MPSAPLPPSCQLRMLSWYSNLLVFIFGHYCAHLKAWLPRYVGHLAEHHLACLSVNSPLFQDYSCHCLQQVVDHVLMPSPSHKYLLSLELYHNPG